MKKILSHKIRIYPNNMQETLLFRACGTKRFAYNWALEEHKKHYEKTGESLSGYDLSKLWTLAKKAYYRWAYEVTKYASQKAIHQLGDAMKNFFAGRARFPKFKKRGKCKNSFYIGNSHFKIDENYIDVPKLGWVRMAERLRFEGRLISATISESAGKWFASIQIELSDSYIYSHICETQDICGVDVGVREFVLDDGTKIKVPRIYRKLERRLKRFQRDFSRKEKGSKNRIKARKKLSKFHHRIGNIRKDFLHKLTTKLVKENRFIGIEDLNVAGMVKNRKLSKSISDASFYEFRRQLEYKSEHSGSTIVIADRFFPSTKTCSICGKKTDLKLSQRDWVCNCGASHDRDVNAAINLRNLAAGYADNKNTCGEESSGGVRKNVVKLSSKKQENGDFYV
jgi:putative transposase